MAFDPSNTRDRPLVVVPLLLAILGGPALGTVYMAMINRTVGPLGLVTAAALGAVWTILLVLLVRELWRERGTLHRRLATAQAELDDRLTIEGKLRHEALHDSLTDLPNRALVLDRIAQCIARMEREKDYCFAVLYLDLDDLKIVNDSLGHDAGDRLLIEIARRLVACLRTLDSVSRPAANTTARLGGDEFVILLDGLRSPENASVVADRIARTVAEPIQVRGHEIVTTLSIGIAVNNASYTQPDEILRDADTALYEAKEQGKGRQATFDAAMRANALHKLEVKNDLRRAMEAEELEVRYQPIVALADERVVGLEALLRWNHPRRGTLTAAEFLPVAESLGLTIRLGEWVTRQACTQMRQWRAKSSAVDDLFLSINVSCKQFYDTTLFETIDAILVETGFEPSRLMLELTEAVIMERPGHTEAIMSALRDRRLGLHMDDFGTGYSSLSHLHQLPISAVKLDKTYVHHLTTESYAATARAVVALAHGRGMKVIAEGVETAEQAALLLQFDCDLAQGYYFSPPVKTDSVATLICDGIDRKQSA